MRLRSPPPQTAAFLTQKCALPNRTIKFEIWDTAGQERFASLAPMYYRNAQAALVVYDLTKPASLRKAKHWVAELQRQASPGIVIALVGNKLDLCAEAAAASAAAATGDQTGGDGDGDGDGGGGDDGGAGSAAGESGAAPESSASASGPGPETEAASGPDSATTTKTTPEVEADAETATSPNPSPPPADARQIPTRDAASYADEEGLLFFETSAKTGAHVPSVFYAIANAIPEQNLRGGRGASGAGGAAGGVGGGAGGGVGAPSARVDLRERAGADAERDGCAC